MESTKPFNSIYIITYIDKAGETQTAEFIWSEDMPSERDVAIGMRDRLLGEFAPITDKYRKDLEDTSVRELRLAGFTNFKVERAIQADIDVEHVVEELNQYDVDGARVAEVLIRQDQANVAEQLMQEDATVLRALAKK